MFNWLRKKNQTNTTPVLVDIHSHLLPGLDDGVQTWEESEAILRRFSKAGYKKVITTPHVISDSYRNTSEGILRKLSELRSYLASLNIPIEVDAAAEYYLDEELVRNLEKNIPLLTFGKNYLLFETNFITEPLNLKEFIFQVTTRGYKPVLAHPERYMFLQANFEKAEDLIDRGVLFQVNINSLSGYYSKPAQVTAKKLIDRGWVHFVGSDCHNLQHMQVMEQSLLTPHFQRLMTLPLLNNSLINLAP